MQFDPKTAQTEGAAVAADQAAILNLTYRMRDAWKAGDADAYGRIFTADSDYVAFDGTHLRGRDANVSHHQLLFDTVLKDSELVFEGVPQIRMLSRDVAVMHAMGSVLMRWQNQLAAKQRSNQTYVVQRGSDGWLITAFHNTRHRPMKLPKGAMLALILFFMRLRRTAQRKSE